VVVVAAQLLVERSELAVLAVAVMLAQVLVEMVLLELLIPAEEAALEVLML